MIFQLSPAVAAQVHGMLEAAGEIFLMEYNSGMQGCGKLSRVLVGEERSMFLVGWDEC